MRYTLQLTKIAKKELICLEKSIQKRIVQKLRFYIIQDNPLQYAKKLKNNDIGTYRFRIGRYRVIFDVNDKSKIIILLILRIKHRKEIYKLARKENGR